MSNFRMHWLAWLLAVGLLLGLAPAVCAQAPSRLPAIPLGFHVNGGELENLMAAHAAGAEHAVVVFSWRDIEPVPGYHYWERIDAVLRAADYYGIQVVARLDRPPAWALDDEDPTPWRLDAYADFVGQVANRYGTRLAGIILWNEPNLSLEWHGERPDPAAYAALLQRAYPVAKAKAPDLPVLMAGLAFTTGDDVTALDDLNYLAAVYAAGGGPFFDVLAMHPYGFGAPPESAPDPTRLNFRRLELQRAIMAVAGDGTKPVWITEMGWRIAAPNPDDAWQVVAPAEQERYTLAALAYVAEHYPWIERITLWEIAQGRDRYGYGLWHGPQRTTPLYATLVALTEPAAPPVDPPRREIEILAPDAIVRLGDIGTLHPHWVHLYGGGENFSPMWRGHFFLTAAEAAGDYTLLLETMQIDQPTNRVLINGREMGRLAPRARPDPTSTWAQQRLALPAGTLRPGANTVTIASGQRNPIRQYAWWRWENFQLRDVRLSPAAPNPPRPAAAPPWTELAVPFGWAEVSRLRYFSAAADDAGELWVMGNRAGQLWTARPVRGDATLRLRDAAADGRSYIFRDVLRHLDGTVAATDQGLLWRATPAGAWQSVALAPAAPAYAVVPWRDELVAAFEGQGVWAATMPAGPWRLLGLPGLTVLDLLVGERGELIAATSAGVYVNSDDGWTRLPPLPAAVAENDHPAAGRFISQLVPGHDGRWVVRNQDRFWTWSTTGWTPFGPEELAGELYSVIRCCGAETLVGSDRRGLWSRQPDGTWTRADGGYFDRRKITAGLALPDRTVVATENGLFESGGRAHWTLVAGLQPTVTELLVDPSAPARWYAGTPAGLWRTDDRGATWASISPPWVVWDMAFDRQGRLFVARGSGLAWTDAPAATEVAWFESAGMESVTFFHVAPHPEDGERVWAGSWGNDIGVSEDRGRRLVPLHNGLETLSVLTILWHPTPGQITIGTIEGLYRSDDDGASWFKLPGALAEQSVYALEQTEGGTILAGAADGLWQSSDYGVTWTRVATIPEVTVLAVDKLEDASGTRYWAGTEGLGIWESRDGGVIWQAQGLTGKSVFSYQRSGEQWIAATADGLFSAPPVEPLP